MANHDHDAVSLQAGGRSSGRATCAGILFLPRLTLCLVFWGGFCSLYVTACDDGKKLLDAFLVTVGLVCLIRICRAVFSVSNLQGWQQDPADPPAEVVSTCSGDPRHPDHFLGCSWGGECAPRKSLRCDRSCCRVLTVSPTGLQNDHKALMKQVEEALHQLHAREKEKHAKDEAEALAEALSQNLPQAFAKVNAVTPGSPASISGLQIDDEIVEFGSVNINNFQNLQNIATVVQHSEGRPLSVTVIRSGKKVHVGLTPKRWAGKGLLGCNIIPLQR
ncbi:26S proteasome non-ATPase regulatory subunit 9 [Athene cunicularia]|uniref:26S proteasome non-ATPase regulatory subunit 9 n=1 Tax=Athene cunicularia TaxID=194338 RepID=UPI000EF70E17|nr:26S proteasome non-ATPase regulatory subunit 9 [Athene cunicularia]